MKKIIKTGLVLLSTLILVAGCKTGPGASKGDDAPLYPITLDGQEIIVGQTGMQTFLDAGLKITMPTTDTDGQRIQVEVDASTELEKNSYYTDGMIWITDDIFANISMVTEEKPVLLGEAVISFMSIHLSAGEASDLERIAFNGVPVSKLSREKAAEIFPDFEGDDNMRYEYGDGHQYQIRFNAEGTCLDDFSVQKSYNVDWESEN